VRDAPVWGYGKEPLRQAVVEGQRRFKTAHRLDLACALAGDIHDLPERDTLPVRCATQRPRKGPHADPEPAPRASPTRMRSVELLVSGLAALGGAIEPEEGLSRIGLAAEQLLQRRVPARAPAGEALQGAVAIERNTLLVDDLEAAVEPVGNHLHQLGFGRALAQAQIAKQQPEDEEGAGDRQQGQQSLHGHLARADGKERNHGETASCCQAEDEQQRAGGPWQAPPAEPRRGRRQVLAGLYSCHGV